MDFVIQSQVKDANGNYTVTISNTYTMTEQEAEETFGNGFWHNTTGLQQGSDRFINVYGTLNGVDGHYVIVENLALVATESYINGDPMWDKLKPIPGQRH
jgi:hypothetical protein